MVCISRQKKVVEDTDLTKAYDTGRDGLPVVLTLFTDTHGMPTFPWQ